MPFVSAPPLHSRHPSGVVSAEWIYFWNGKQDCVRKNLKVHVPHPPEYVGFGLWIYELSLNWKTLSPETQATWLSYARRFRLTLFLAYQKYNMIRGYQGLEAVDEPEPYG